MQKPRNIKFPKETSPNKMWLPKKKKKNVCFYPPGGCEKGLNVSCEVSNWRTKQAMMRLNAGISVIGFMGRFMPETTNFLLGVGYSWTPSRGERWPQCSPIFFQVRCYLADPFDREIQQKIQHQIASLKLPTWISDVCCNKNPAHFFLKVIWQHCWLILSQLSHFFL